MKYCKDCIYRVHYYGGTDGCERPISSYEDPVKGVVEVKTRNTCYNERQAGKTLFTRRVKCGPDAMYYVPFLWDD